MGRQVMMQGSGDSWMSRVSSSSCCFSSCTKLSMRYSARSAPCSAAMAAEACACLIVWTIMGTASFVIMRVA